MPVNKENYTHLTSELGGNIQLVAVSKNHSVPAVKELYDLGQRDFGENYVQELVDKYTLLPKDIRWHFIGHLQSNKVKYIVPFVHLIHGVDSLRLLEEINKQGKKINKVINCLLQVHIAAEETKFGLDEEELQALATRITTNNGEFEHVKIFGLMGMASFTDNEEKVRREFRQLRSFFDKYTLLINPHFTVLSMGMSADYKIAVEEGSNMVRIGSLLFGARAK